MKLFILMVVILVGVVRASVLDAKYQKVIQWNNDKIDVQFNVTEMYAADIKITSGSNCDFEALTETEFTIQTNHSVVCLFIKIHNIDILTSQLQKMEQTSDDQITLEWTAILLISFVAAATLMVICWILCIIRKLKVQTTPTNLERIVIHSGT